MRINIFLFSLLFALVFASCGKDDTKMEEIPEETMPFFKADFNWDADFLELAVVPVAADSVPLGVDVAWENPVSIDFDSDTPTANIASIVKEDPDDDYYTLGLIVQNEKDTILFAFELYGELEAKSYTYAGLDILEGIFGGEVDIPAGTVVPYLISEKSEASITPALMTIFGAADFTGSTFTISEIDSETQEVSGEFNINFVIPADEDDPATPVMKVENGVFNKVNIQ